VAEAETSGVRLLLALKLLGPDQLDEARLPDTVAVRVSGDPEHIGPLLLSVTEAPLTVTV